MKILLFGLVVLVAWNAGLGLLMAGCVVALLLTQIGSKSIRNGDIRGKDKIAIGIGLGCVTLFASLLKLVLVFLAWTSLVTVFPELVPSLKALWAQISFH